MMKIFNFCLRFFLTKIFLCRVFDITNHSCEIIWHVHFHKSVETVRNEIYFHEYGRYTILKREWELIYIFIRVCFELLVIQVGHIDLSIWLFQYRHRNIFSAPKNIQENGWNTFKTVYNTRRVNAPRSMHRYYEYAAHFRKLI